MDVCADVIAYGPHNLPDHACAQHQGTLAAAMPLPLAQFASPMHDAAAAVVSTGQDNQRRQQIHRQAGRRAAAPIHIYIYI